MGRTYTLVASSALPFVVILYTSGHIKNINMTTITAPFPTLLAGYSREQETDIIIKCHDAMFKSVDVVDDSNGEILFTVSSKGAASLSWRRTIRTPSGRRLFDLRHMGYATKNDWVVEKKGIKKICSLRHPSSMVTNRSDLDAVIGVSATADDKIQIRSGGMGALCMTVSWQGVVVALIMNIEANNVQSPEEKGLDCTVWKARIHKGVDISFVSDLYSCFFPKSSTW
jgi:hypothetical protein